MVAACTVAVTRPATGALAGSQAPVGAVLIDHVVATVDGEAITWSALRDETLLLGLRIDSRLDRRQTLELLVNELLFVREARKFVIIADASVDETIDARAQDVGANPVVSEEARRERVRRELMLTQFGERAFGQDAPRMTDLDVQQYYASHIADYRAPRQYLVRGIRRHAAGEASAEALADARASLGAVRDALIDGSATVGRLERLATDDASLSVDEEANWAPAARLGAPIAAVVELLEPGEWSVPLRLGAGYAIVQVVDIAEEWTQELGPDLMDAIARADRAERLQVLMQDWVEKRRQQADIRILDDALRPSSEGTEANFDPEDV